MQWVSFIGGGLGEAAAGVLFLVVRLAVLTGADKIAEAYLVNLTPDWLTDVTTRF